MQPYEKRAEQVVSEADIAAQILLSAGNDDIELIPLCPRRPDRCIAREDFTARQLRPVGVIGLSGLKALSAFREPLEPYLVDVIAEAFLEYARVLLGESFLEQAAAAEVAELERMYALIDPR
ncbi:MAG: hypothetical protein ACLPH3_05895 [Terracidiphilus sp.]